MLQPLCVKGQLYIEETSLCYDTRVGTSSWLSSVNSGAGTRWIIPGMMNCPSYRPSSWVVWLLSGLIKFFSMLFILSMQKDFQLEICSQRRAESNWHIFLIIVQRMFTYQLTIYRKYYSFVFSLLPVVLFLCVRCMLHPGSERGLAICLLGCGLAPLLLPCSLSSFSQRCTTLLAVPEYLWLWLMMMMASSTRDLGTLLTLKVGWIWIAASYLLVVGSELMQS